MDCEKFEDALMDELYGELDEVTSAAVRRHASGCARCAERLASLRATRRVLASSSFAQVAPPVDLEARIFAAAGEARKVVPIRSRMTRFVSVAGRWAMRPQTAMAAVFLLTIGSSVVLMRDRSSRMSAVSVTDRGAPAEAAPVAAAPTSAASAATPDELGNDRGAAAHGVEQPIALGTATAAPAIEAPREAAKGSASTGAVAMLEKKEADEGAFEGRSRAAAPSDDLVAARPSRPAARAPSPAGGGGANANYEALGGAPPAKAAAAPAAPPPVAQAGPATAADAKPSFANAPATSSSSDPFADAMATYRAGRYAEATQRFDALAQQGNASAALWAARSAREGSGCAAAASRFDRVSASSYGTTPGYDATLEAGRCYRALGSFEAARARFARLLTVPSHAAQAQAELDAMSPSRPNAAAKPASKF